ncbi:helix-turn-helix transcriptional regulator [Streptomyces sclerotialus]|uniref:helix-turn-helix transcriptional regulator n=1 Tax=Streptomyces sclerotialus TaxID=1957 RepID=UPI0004C562E1
MTTQRFDSNSLEETEAFLAASYAPIRIIGSVVNPHTQITQNTTDQLSVDRCALNYSMAYSADSLGKVCLVSLDEGTLIIRSGGQEESFGPGDVFLLVQPDLPYTGEAHFARYTLALFDPALLTQAAVTDAGQPCDPVRLTGQRPVTPRATRQLQATITFLREDVLAEPAAHTAPLAVANAARLLATSTLAALPNATVTAPVVRTDSRDGNPSTLRRAITFIEDNAHRDIALADIAASVPVTPRALQYAFRRHANTTPLGYLRRVRLAQAHTDLEVANSRNDATVTGIALRWGFFHPGRFAALYKATYGRPPSTTLRPG